MNLKNHDIIWKSKNIHLLAADVNLRISLVCLETTRRKQKCEKCIGGQGKQSEAHDRLT